MTTHFIKGLVVAYMDFGCSSQQTSEKIKQLYQKHSPNVEMLDEQLEKEFTIAKQTCAKIYKRFKETLTYNDQREGNGSKSIYNDEEKEQISEMVMDNIGKSLNELQKDPEINYKNACVSTFRSTLFENGIKAFKQPQEIEMTEEHKEQRVKFAKKVIRWKQRWETVIFTDESQLYIDPQNRYFYAKSSDDIEENLIKVRERYPLKIHVWGAISNSQPLELIWIQGYLNSEQYESIINQFLNKQKDNLPQNFIFQQDNSAVHTAKRITDFFNQKKVNLLEWPSKSPDLSPIENVLQDRMQRVIANQGSQI
ncbi:hypothetical protein ABPG72_016552 [Tetrahymena utriculariae]